MPAGDVLIATAGHNRRTRLAKTTTLLSVSVLIEEDADEARRVGWQTSAEDEVQKAVLAAIAVLLRDRPHVRVEWASSQSTPLDGKPWFGRRTVGRHGRRAPRAGPPYWFRAA